MEYVEFRVDNEKRFNALCHVFSEIKKDKDTKTWREDEDWLAFFDEEALSHFWFPTEEEEAEHFRRWFETPVDQRWNDPSFVHPWDFDSMIECFRIGEYELISCRLISTDIARIEFFASVFPYGGTGCMHGLIEAFGFTVLGEDDGTGYQKRIEALY